MAKQVIEFEGAVTETLPGGKFRVNLPDQDREVIAFLSGRMRMHHIKIVVGDKVKIEFSPYDLENGRISFRYSGFNAPKPTPSATPEPPVSPEESTSSPETVDPKTPDSPAKSEPKNSSPDK